VDNKHYLTLVILFTAFGSLLSFIAINSYKFSDIYGLTIASLVVLYVVIEVLCIPLHFYTYMKHRGNAWFRLTSVAKAFVIPLVFVTMFFFNAVLVLFILSVTVLIMSFIAYFKS